MIEQSKLEQLMQLFGKELPPRHLFFATRQTESIITPAMLRGLYHEPTLAKAFQKLKEDFDQFTVTSTQLPQVTKAVPPAVKPVKPIPPKVTVKKDE